jgi:hypothetical protein
MEIIRDNNTDEYMYRYLEKYIGKYRVMAEVDESTGKFPTSSSFEDLYIPCRRKCVIKHTYYGNDILALCFYDNITTAKNVESDLTKNKIEHKNDFPESCNDWEIIFNAKNIDKVAKIVGAKTSGKNIHPLSVRNLNKKISDRYDIPKEDLDKLYLVTENLNRTDKMHFFRNVNKEYIEYLKTTYDVDVKTHMKVDGLKLKEFVHMNNYWDDYITFVKNKLKTN